MNVPLRLHSSPAAVHFSSLSDCLIACCLQCRTARLQLSEATAGKDVDKSIDIRKTGATPARKPKAAISETDLLI